MPYRSPGSDAGARVLRFVFFSAAAGAFLVATPDWRAAFSFDTRQPGTILAAMGAAALWGASTVFGRYVVARVPALVLTGLRFAVALPMLAVLFAVQPQPDRRMPASVDAVSSLVTMALIPGLAALIFYYHGLRLTAASPASVAELAFPITAVTVNWYILGIRLTSSQIMGAVVLVAAVTALSLLGSISSNTFRSRPGGDTPAGHAA